MKKIDNISERLFTELCNSQFLKGFVFHSPKYYDPTEKEVGDIVLWVRLFLIVFEVISRKTSEKGNITRFIQRIGDKRDQLANDFKVFGNNEITINLINKNGEELKYNHIYFNKESFRGVVIIDSNLRLGKLHFNTIKKSLEQEFPMAIMKKSDFLYLTSEIDTIPDLSYYLKDRAKFLENIFLEDTNYILDLDSEMEKKLIAFYKMNEYKLDYILWQKLRNKDLWRKFQREYKEKIAKRNKENQNSIIVDKVIEYIRIKNSEKNNTFIHAFELASTTRRQRAIWLAPKLIDAFSRLKDGNKERFFSFFNEITGCWQLYYFKYGGSNKIFRKRVEKITKQKLFFEMDSKKFEFAVLSFAFLKSQQDTENFFDKFYLFVDDARNYKSIPIRQLKKAKKFFGRYQICKITEFSE